MHGSNGKSNGKGYKSTSPVVTVNRVEFRVLGVSNDLPEDKGLTLLKQFGFVGANGMATAGMFVFRHPIIPSGGSVRRSSCEILACDGVEREILSGIVVDMDTIQSDKTLFYFLISVKHIQWLFVCDRNPRIEVTRLGLLKGVECFPPIFRYRFQLSEDQRPHVVSEAKKGCSSLGVYTPPVRDRIAKEHGPYQTTLTIPDPSVRHEIEVNENVIPTPRSRPAPVASPTPPVAPPVLRASAPPSPAVPPTPKPVTASPLPVVKEQLVFSPVQSAGLLKLIKEAMANGKKITAVLSEICPFAPSEETPLFSGQPRVVFDEAEMERLKASIAAVGLLDPLLVITIVGHPTYKWELIDGERRYRCLKRLGLTNVDVIVIKLEHARLIKQAQHLVSLARNFCRRGHTPMETSKALHEQIKAGMTPEALASIIGRTVSYVYTLVGLQRLVPELKVLLDHPTPERERMRFEAAKRLSQIHPEQQVRIWNQVKGLKSQRYIIQKLREISKEYLVNPKGRGLRPRRLHVGLVRALDAVSVSVGYVETVAPDRMMAMIKFIGTSSVDETVQKLTMLEDKFRQLRLRILAARPTE